MNYSAVLSMKSMKRLFCLPVLSVSASLWRRIPVVGILALVGLMAGCNKGGDAASDTTTALVQIVNAIPDSPFLTVTFDPDLTSTDEQLNTVYLLTYQQSSTHARKAGEVSVTVRFEDTATGGVTSFIPETKFTLATDKIYTVLLTGSFAAPAIRVLEKPTGTVSATGTIEAEFQMIQLSSIASLDVSLTNPTSASGSVSRTMAKGDVTDPFRLPGAGDYRLTLAVPGSAPLYDSGVVNFSNGSRQTVIIADKVLPDRVTAEVFFITASNTSRTFNNVLAKPRLRMMNGISNETAVEFKLTDSFSGDPIDTRTLNYRQITNYFQPALDSVFMNVGLYPASTPAVEAYSTIVSLSADTYYSLITTGVSTNSNLSSQLLVVERRPQGTLTNITFMNAANIPVVATDGSTTSLRLSLYILKAGESLSGKLPSATSISYLGNRTFTAPATPSILVATEAGTDKIVAGPLPIVLQEKQSILVAVTEAVGGGRPLAFSVK